MKRFIFYTLVLLSFPLRSLAQNDFPTTGDAKIQNAKMVIETSQWLPSLITLRDTHYSPYQVYNFQIESDGLKIRQDDSIRFLFKSGGGFYVNDGNVEINSVAYAAFRVVRPNGANISMGVSTGSHQGHLASTGELKFLTDTENGDIQAKMFLNRQGNMGIGTTTPAFRLQLSDPIGGAALGIERGGKLWRFDMASNGNKLFVGHTDAPNMVTFDNIGRLGIGTIAPDAKLTVKGDIHTQEVKVDLNGAVAPDYVFKDDYNLPSLEEVQAYIDTHGHLPNIPSAKEMEANGIGLKAMNLKLLEKIEELTLYILKQQVEIKYLKTKMK